MQEQTEQLLLGAAAGNPYRAFGFIGAVTPVQLRKGCRQKQAMFHPDKGGSLALSQLANGCADVLSGKATALGDDLITLASQLLQELQEGKEQEHYVKLIQEWRARDRKAHIDRVMTAENKRKAEMLLGTFEHVSRQEASRITEVRRVFQRALCLSNHEAGWIMQHVGSIAS